MKPLPIPVANQLSTIICNSLAFYTEAVPRLALAEGSPGDEGQLQALNSEMFAMSTNLAWWAEVLDEHSAEGLSPEGRLALIALLNLLATSLSEACDSASPSSLLVSQSELDGLVTPELWRWISDNASSYAVRSVEAVRESLQLQSLA